MKFLIWGLGGAAVLAAIVLFVVPLLNQGSSDRDFAMELPEDGPGRAGESEDIPDEAVVTRDNLGASAAPEGGGEDGGEAPGEATRAAIGGAEREADGGASVPETGDETREAATEVPTRSQEPTRTRPVRESQAAERAEAAASTPATPPAASPPPATVEATGGAQGAPIMKSTRFAGQPPFFAIHITSFRSEDRATRDAERLGRETGHGADYIDFDMTSGENAGLWYRVIVGRFSDIETARREAREIVNEGVSTYARVFYITGS